jgi:hypothetical protein
MIDMDAWDAAGFAAGIDERVVIPGQHSLDMLADATYLTRLFTVLSPHEMLDDPTFHASSGLPEVGTTIDVTRVNDCDDGPTVYELPDGRSVALTDGGTMPDLDLPAAERIEHIPMTGPAQVEVDNGPDIDKAIDAYNATRLSGPAPNCSVRRVPAEGVLTFLAVFGIAGLQRRGGRRRRSARRD